MGLCFRLLLLIFALPASGSEFTHGVETLENRSFTLYLGAGAGGTSRFQESPFFVASGTYGGGQFGLLLEDRATLLVTYRAFSSSIRPVGNAESFALREREWGLAGRFFPFGHDASGIRPFFGGGLARIIQEFEYPPRFLRENGWSGTFELGVEWGLSRALSLWGGLGVSGGLRGREEPGGASAEEWSSVRAIGRSASWFFGSGVGIYF
jgi:hypothetical protein